MENNKKSSIIWTCVGIFIGIIIGVMAGYYYGNNAGLAKGIIIGAEEGRTTLLAEQAKEEAAKLKAIEDAANPFSEQKSATNPFQDMYKNPFTE